MGSGRSRRSPRFSGFTFDPQCLLIFTETRWFTSDWKDIGLNDEEDLAALQFLIVSDPKGPPVVSKTGGLRKLRFSPPGANRGKRGALRVGYAYYERFGHVLLIVVYPKNVQDTLTAEECAACKRLIDEHHELLAQHYAR